MIQLSPESRKQRKLAFESIKNRIENKIQGTTVHAFGSHETKLLLPNADIDVVVLAAHIGT